MCVKNRKPSHLHATDPDGETESKGHVPDVDPLSLSPSMEREEHLPHWKFGHIFLQLLLLNKRADGEWKWWTDGERVNESM